MIKSLVVLLLAMEEYGLGLTGDELKSDEPTKFVQRE